MICPVLDDVDDVAARLPLWLVSPWCGEIQDEAGTRGCKAQGAGRQVVTGTSLWTVDASALNNIEGHFFNSHSISLLLRLTSTIYLLAFRSEGG